MDNKLLYPPSWLCMRCKRPLKLHLDIENDRAFIPRNWCFNLQDTQIEYDEHPSRNKHQWSFEPADNLTQVELLATQKNLIK